VLGDGRRRAPGALERVAVGAHRLRGQFLGAGVRAEEGTEGAVDGGVGAPRLGRALARGDLRRANGQAGGVNELADQGRRGGTALQLAGHRAPP
jgi:hypothetical protein